SIRSRRMPFPTIFPLPFLAKSGALKANKATAHKLARIIYNMLKNKTEYNDPGDEKYLKEYRRRNIKNLERKAAFFGLKLVEVEVEAE
ncbi:transposase, partial [Candidatus Magnetomorum sp. HK-1]